MTATQIIEDYDRFTLFPQPISSHAPDVSRATCHQNCHTSLILRRDRPNIVTQSTVTVAPENRWGGRMSSAFLGEQKMDGNGDRGG
jgi:hypothetical protein